MRKIIPLWLTVFITFFSNSNVMGNQYGNVPQKITVAGKIENYDPNQKIDLYANRIGFDPERIVTKTDSVGNFVATFDSYIPLDAWVYYKKTLLFLVLLHPGDSLFIQFDGKYDDQLELLKSVDFRGNRANANRYATIFQQMFYSDKNLQYDWFEDSKSIKDYNKNQYLQFLDTLQQKGNKLYDKFVAENNPDEESKKWAQLFVENAFYQNFDFYLYHNRKAGTKLDTTWTVFYDRLCNALPVEPSKYISASSLWYLSKNLYSYIQNKFSDRELLSAIENFPDSLMRQIMLTTYFNNDLEYEQSIVRYELDHDIADKYIKETFLKEPLLQKYFQIKSRIENPQIYTEAVLKEASNLSINQIVNDILQQNKGKVIYVDFWGTWCSPCIAEFPNSKIAEQELRGKDVVFVYICLESAEKQWKATLDKFQLGGQHYFLSNKQSAEIRKLFELTGVPFYLLIDKDGVIKESGNHLRPLVAKNKIKEMLK